MTADEIVESMDKVMEELDALVSPLDGEVGKYASCRANRDFMKEKKKFIIAGLKQGAEGSDAKRTMEAEASTEYKDFLWELAKAEGLSYQVTAEKDLLEKKLDTLRSKLSYIKSTHDNRI